MKPHCISWLALFVLLGFLAPAVSHGGEQLSTAVTQQTPGTVELTAAEHQFIKDHPVIRVQNENDYPPFDFVLEGEPAGFSIDYLRLVAEKTGLNFKFINGYTWGEILENIQNRGLDVIHTCIAAPERKTFASFTEAYIKPIYALVVPDDAGVESLNDLKGKKLAMLRGTKHIKDIKALNPGIEVVEYDSTIDVLRSVVFGQSDAAYDTLQLAGYLIKEKGLPGLKFKPVPEVKNEGGEWTIGVRNDWPLLLGIISKGMAALSPEEENSLKSKWFGLGEKNTPRFSLTREEEDFLKAHPSFSVAFDVDWPPVEAIDEKNGMQGISADYLARIGKMLGMEFIPARPRPWKEMVQVMKNGQLDMFSAISSTPQRQKWLAFTTSYLNFPRVIITTKDVPYVNGVDDLAGSVVAVADGYSSQEILEYNHPQLSLLATPTAKEGLMAVSRGDAFAFVGSLAAVSHIISREGLTGLKVSGETSYAYEISMATRQDDVVLLGLLQKGLDALSQKERNAINSKWMGITYEHRVDYTLLWEILGAAAVVVLLILLWNRRLRVMALELKVARDAVQRTNKELESRARLDGLTNIVNRSWFDEVLATEWSRAIRDKSVISLILCDVDFFKAYNDCYGHIAGDECLKAVAAMLDSMASRPADLAARYGGEEFVILLPNTDLGGACALAETVRGSIQQLGIPHVDSSVSPNLSLSFGVASMRPVQNLQPELLVQAADEVLYQAKKNGRNRVERAEQAD